MEKQKKQTKTAKTAMIVIRIEPEIRQAVMTNLKQAEGKSLSALIRDFLKDKMGKIIKKEVTMK